MVSEKGHLQSSARLCAELAALYGVQTSYRDTRGAPRESPPESVIRVLSALGAEIAGGTDAAPLAASRLRAAIDARRMQLWSRIVDPVLIAWDGALPEPVLRLPAGVRGRLQLTLTLEGGEEWRHEFEQESLSAVGEGRLGRQRFAARRVPVAAGKHRPAGGSSGGLERRLPLGYHLLQVHAGDEIADATVISAPRRCWAPERGPKREWGVFAPLYALRSGRDWGAGDLADLEGLQEWVGAAGGSAVATLPLLAGYLDRPFEPAPYSPVSRMFWNEFYLAVDRIPDWDRCTAAREWWTTPSVQAGVARLRQGSLVDYGEVMALKRRALEELSRWFFSQEGGGQREALAAYVRACPELAEYASFRAKTEAAGVDWRSRPNGQRQGRSDSSGCPLQAASPVESASESERYHLYCQWRLEQQMARLSGVAETAGVAQVDGGARGGLFLDLPVGVHPGGFDTWRWPGLFADGVSIGAPPDSFFAGGQDWDSPPLHPERIQEQGHRYLARCLQHNMRHAGYLRIDHVMSLHRLFWVPRGFEPTQGVYVTYPADQLHAVLCLESHRNRTVVVGEDLGTVPVGVRAGMRRHGILGTWVLQSSLRPRAERPVESVPRKVVAGLNTHDMFPFAGFVRGDDIEARLEMGQVAPEAARRELAARRRTLARLAASWAEDLAGEGGGVTPRTPALLHGCLAYLATSTAALVLVNLEDLLHETKPQNLPGSGGERGNWRRKVAGREADVKRAIGSVARELAGP